MTRAKKSEGKLQPVWARIQWTLSLAAALIALPALAAKEEAIPELSCSIAENGSSLGCQYVKGTERKIFVDRDIAPFIDRASLGAYLTVKSKRGFERTYEIDPGASIFKKLSDLKKAGSAAEVGRQKLDIFSEIERKAIQVSDGLDTIFIQSDLLKYDPSIASNKCRSDMRVYGDRGALEKNLEALSEENKALSVYLTGLISVFREKGSCLADFNLSVSDDGTVDLSQVQALAKAFRQKCKHK
jgi:hypothetical protein